MNIRVAKSTKDFLSVLTLHLALIFGSTYFLTPELTLYPYFISKGLIPYIDLIDQHLPIIFFGPINLSQLNLLTPTSTLITFAIITILTDLGAYFYLQQTKKKDLTKTISLLTFVLLQVILAAHFYWIESFLLLALTWTFYFHASKSKYRDYLTGLLLSIFPATRPTLILITLPFFLQVKNKKQFLTSFIIIPALQLYWLLSHHLLLPFISMMQFNKDFYAVMAQRLPNKAELLVTFTVIIYLIVFTKEKRQQLINILLLSLAVFPRFELFHLLPLATLSLKTNLPKRYQLLTLSFLIFLIIFQKKHFVSNNFFYPQSLYDFSQNLQNKYPSSNYYFFGGADQLYILTNSTPPGSYYLPSLPWYHANQSMVDRQLLFLELYPDSPVIVNQEASLNNQTLKDYAPKVWQFINTNYNQVEQINNYSIYIRQKHNLAYQ